MLFAPTAAKHDLTASAAVVGGLKNSNCGDAAVVKKKHQAAALLTNGLRHFNHQQSQQQHRQHHNHQQQQQQQQHHHHQQQQSQDDLKVKQQQSQHNRRNLQEYHVPNSAKNEQQQKQRQQQQQQLTMDAMKKLDAKLVAYLTGEQRMASRIGQKIEEQEVEQQQVPVELGSSTRPLNNVVGISANGVGQLELFKRISGVKLQMEALTLQPEGTKRMELLQNDTRPIFTVECQLSHDLIKNVPQYDMFHVMQFESEKFQSLTQCTRFGQEAERAVKLDLNVNAVNNNNNKEKNDPINDKVNLGHIHFTVWWREPGTCFNEMLGMGLLPLEELYAASVLEQCKNIIVQRRNVHLANLYFKISLQIGPAVEVEAVAASDAATADDGINLADNKPSSSGEYAVEKRLDDAEIQ